MNATYRCINMNADQFRDIFYVLHNIDKADLVAAGVIAQDADGGSDWTRFNNDIGTFVIKLNQENLEALFDLVRRRLPAFKDSTSWRAMDSAPKDTAILTYGFGYEVAHFNTMLGGWVACWDHRPIQPEKWVPLPASIQEEGKP